MRQSEAHGENADEQLANLQKRIWLIEFLRLGLVIVYQGNGGAAKINKSGKTRFFYFAKTFREGVEPGYTRVSTALTVPLENEVFVGDSPQDTHGEYADEQLTTIQKRIYLIEFLIMVGLLFVKGAGEKS